MSVIVHRCSACNATELHHPPSARFSTGRSICDTGEVLPPELLSTWNTLTDEPVDIVAYPGSEYRGFGGVVQLCNCEDCLRLYTTDTETDHG